MRRGFADDFALFVLDGQQTTRMSTEKSSSLRAIAVAEVLEKHLEGRSLTIEDIPEIEKLARSAAKDTDRKELEKTFQQKGHERKMLDIVPSIIGCDMNYYTSGVDIYEYRTEEKFFLDMLENLRRAFLVPGEMDEDSFIALWLMRECVLYRVIDLKERKTVVENVEAFTKTSEVYQKLWNIEFRAGVEHFVANLIKKKKIAMKNPWMQGVAMFAPDVQKEDSIFIDFVVLGTDPSQRRKMLREFIAERGHHVSEVVYDGQALLKIDNRYYHVMPGSKACKFPIQGAYIIPIYDKVD